MVPRIRYLLLAGVIAGALSQAASATNIVANPGFEASPSAATGWDIASGDSGVDSALPNSGSNDAFMGIGSLGQTLTTVNSETYTVSFFLAADQTTIADTVSTMNVSFGATDLLGGTPIAGSSFSPSTYQFFSYTVTASGTSSALTFTGFTTGDAGNWYLDDVSVTGNDQTPPLPEPSSMLILAAGVGLVRLARRRA